ncbi:MAG: hypothetical protein E7019_00855 [Alphaproteobacteria bacterium]|nr:hypothetical protein [Alphaproteobacteria bacterium]
MGNNHVNGKNPVVIPDKDYDKELEKWKESETPEYKGNVREDNPHGGADYPHAHLTLEGDPNTDIVVVKESNAPKK